MVHVVIGEPQVNIQRLGTEAALEVLSRNHIGPSHASRHPPWLDLSFRMPPDDEAQLALLAELSQCNLLQFTFGLSLDRFDDTRAFARQLAEALA